MSRAVVLGRAVAIIAAYCALTLLGGCASVAKHHIGYKNWDHFMFSLKADWNQFVGWAPVATKEDAAKAEQQGDWWGDEVPVWPGR